MDGLGGYVQDGQNVSHLAALAACGADTRSPLFDQKWQTCNMSDSQRGMSLRNRVSLWIVPCSSFRSPETWWRLVVIPRQGFVRPSQPDIRWWIGRAPEKLSSSEGTPRARFGERGNGTRTWESGYSFARSKADASCVDAPSPPLPTPIR